MAVGPADLDLVNSVGLPKSEVEPWIVGREVAACELLVAHKSLSIRRHQDTGADRVSVAFCADEPDAEPVVAALIFVMKQPRRALLVDQQHVQPTIIVE